MINPNKSSEVEKLTSIAKEGHNFLYIYVGDDGTDSEEDLYEDFLLKGVIWSEYESYWVVVFMNCVSEYICVFVREEKNKPSSYIYSGYSLEPPELD